MYIQKAICFFVGILKVNDENSRIRIRDPNPDPLVRGMDPRIRIHTKMSCIRNTGSYGTRVPLKAKTKMLKLSCFNAGKMAKMLENTYPTNILWVVFSSQDSQGNFVCLDAKLKFDDNADFRFVTISRFRKQLFVKCSIEMYRTCYQ